MVLDLSSDTGLAGQSVDSQSSSHWYDWTMQPSPALELVTSHFSHGSSLCHENPPHGRLKQPGHTDEVTGRIGHSYVFSCSGYWLGNLQAMRAGGGE